MLIAIGLNHKTTPIHIREKVAIAEDCIPQALKLLTETYDCSESAILSTCNRVELYCVIEQEKKQPIIRNLKNFFGSFANIEPAIYKEYLYELENEDASFHLFRVAAGLDSLVIGETQILGQVKDCFKLAKKFSTCGPVLTQLFEKSIMVGKRVRAKTEIEKYFSSIPIAAVKFIEQIEGDIKHKKIAIIGSGKISEITARKIAESKPKQIIIANRSLSRAETLAKKVNAIPIKLNGLDFLVDADIAISSTTSPNHIITYEQMEKIMHKRSNRPIVLLDIAVPRDIDPNISLLPSVRLFNIDDLKTIVKTIVSKREQEIANAESIVAKEFDTFVAKAADSSINETIKIFKKKLEKVSVLEQKRLFKNFNSLNNEQVKKIDYFGKAIINKISHTLIKKLKEDPEKYSEVIKDLFEL